ncbi:MAG: hypothetical protein JWP91_305 [Fibrobacteres bacterium]|nr:hypothetical protein [Fibrobacterota bacterium]
MKIRMSPLFSTFAIGLLLGGCEMASAPRDAASEPLANAAQGQGTEVMVIPINGAILGCNGEMIPITGELLITSHTVINGQGETRIRFHNAFRNVTGVDAAGNEYVLAAASTNGFEVIPGPDATVSTNTSDMVLVSKGSGENLQVHLNIHTTVTPSGDVTAEVFNITSECRG